MKNCGWLLLVVGLVGCGRTTVAPKGPQGAAKKELDEGPPPAAVSAVSQATESSQFRDGLHLLSRYISKSDVSKDIELSSPQRDFLRRKMFLSDDELQEVESVAFRPLDSHYLESCALLRDVARNLEKPDVTPLDLVRQAQGWVCRQVLLAAPKENSWLPSDAVLRSGYGNARDRALLFLALLRQFKLADESHIEGCVLDSNYPLVGVLIPTEPDNLYLFDMVLGSPIPGPKGEGMATLAQVRKDPELLKAAGVPRKDFESNYLNCPLTAAAPRMKTLENWIKDQERTVLYMDVVDVHKAVSHAAQVPVRPGNPAPEQGKPTLNSPTRTLSWFWPPEEGGREVSPKDPDFAEARSPWGRFVRFQLEQRARPQLMANFRALKLYDVTSIYLPKDAGDQFMVEALDLVLKFSTQPRDMLLRGQSDALLKRLNRVGRALEEAELMDPAELQSDITNFRARAKQTYLAKVHKDPQAGEMMNQLWGDGYFANLLNLNVELDPRKFDEPVKPGQKKVNPKVLTHMIFAGCKDVLDQNVAYLWAMNFHEESEAKQALADSLKAAGGKEYGAARQRTLESWPNSVSYWNKFVDRYTLSPSSVRERLGSMMRSVPDDFKYSDHVHIVLQALPNLLHDWSRSCYARLNLARALERQGQTQAARTVLDGLARDLTATANSTELQRDIDAYVGLLRKIFQGAPGVIDYPRRVAAEFTGDTLANLQKVVEARRQQLGQ